MEFVCEYAKSSIGSCKACPKAVSKKSLKIGFTPDFDHCGTTWFHFSCFFKKCYYRKELKGTIENPPPFVGLDSLEPKDQERVRKAYEKLVNSLNSGADKAKAGKQPKTDEDEDNEWKPTDKHAEEEEPKFEGYKIGDHMYQIKELLFINISKFKDVVLIAIREFYKPPKGKTLRPGKNGISLTVEQYFKLWSERFSIEDAVKNIKKTLEGADEPSPKKKRKKTTSKAIRKEFEISINRMVSVRAEPIDGKTQVVVDIREYQSPEEGVSTELSPTEKGITLTDEQFIKVLALHNDVVRDLSDNFGILCP